MRYALNQIINADCMDIMREIPDKYFELAVVDPPYGVGSKITNGGTWANKRKNNGYAWDVVPQKKYFDELYRISKNQIIWGANHFVDLLYKSRGWIVWDKVTEGFTAVSHEIAFSSFDRKIEIFHRPHGTDRGFMNKDGGNIHPTEKPVALYRWLLQKYAKPGDKIIDTHSGSGSCAIACLLEKHDFLAIELDPDYYEASVKRFKEEKNQLKLF